MKIFNKKITIGFTIALAFAAGALAYSLGYSMAMKKFNDVVAYNQEKEKMYFRLSEVDKVMRQEYIGDIDEEKLISSLCSGYISGVNDSSCRYLTADEYKKFTSKKIFDDNAVIYESLDDKTGYIKINSVTPETGNMFYNGVKSLYESGIKNFIIDIRNLSGTDLKSVEKCLDVVSEKGDIVSAIDKKGNKEEAYKTNSDRMDIKISVLINKSTNGVPELIASALKDSGLGKLVGEKTAGNAVLEKAIALQDGSGIVYPAAHYVTKKGNVLKGKGVEPDAKIELSSEKKSLLERDELSKEDDNQFLEALKSFS